MSSYTDISIRINLIRGDGSSTDDRLTLTKNLDYGDFEINYSEYNYGKQRIVHEVKGMYREKVMNYLYSLFKNISLDEEPYVNVQFILPAMPSVIVSASKFKDVYYREHFLEMTGTCLDLLENTVNENLAATRAAYSEPMQFTSPPSLTTPSTVRQHIYFDDFMDN
jgi:hypothetical protein